MFGKFAMRCFAPDEGNGGGNAARGTNTQEGSNTTQPTQPPQNTPQFDYEKLASIISGKQTVTEDTILKNYFRQQGLPQEEAQQAMAAFKQRKAANQPDVNQLQTQAAQAQAALRQAQLDQAATLAALGLGLDAKTIPYVLKMADLDQAMGQDGKINEEAMKTALNKVLEDIPALKPQATGAAGFIQVGTSGGTGAQGTNDDALKAAFGL